MPSSRPGTSGATTGRSATTSRPSTSATSGGSTATRPTCGPIPPSRPPSGTWPPWAGPTRSIAQARAALADGDARWSAEILNHVVFDDPDNSEAKALLAEVYDRLGHGAENATWRNFFLTGAVELRTGVQSLPQAIVGDVLSALSVVQVFDAMAIRLDGPRAAADGVDLTLDWHITDLDSHHRVTCRNGVVVQRTVAGPTDGADARYALTKDELLPVLAGLAAADPVEGSGDALATLQAHLDRVDPDFPIVTP